MTESQKPMHADCLHPECIEARMRTERERKARESMPRYPIADMPTDDRYPGWEEDLNDGQPATLTRVAAALVEGQRLAAAGGYEHAGQLSTEMHDRGLFAVVRNRDAEEQTYWVTGVRLLPEEDGTVSLTGAIQFVLEDGETAQARWYDQQSTAKADALVTRMANALARVMAGGESYPQEAVENMLPIAGQILRSYGPDLGVEPGLSDYL